MTPGHTAPNTEAASFSELLDQALQRAGAPVDADAARGQPREWWAVDRGYLSEPELQGLYVQVYGLEHLTRIAAADAAPEFIGRVPLDYARQACVLGLRGQSEDRMRLVVADPHQTEAIDDVARLTGLSLKLALAPREEIIEALNRAYEQRATVVDEVVEQWDVSRIDEQLQALEASDDLLDMAHRAPVIKLVNAILFEAIRHKASDIHIQAEEKQVQVRFRVDGVLYDRMPIPMHLLAPIVSRIKIMGRMNVSERRLPQDGRCTARIGNRVVDLRISSIPCSNGERIVLRLLDKSSGIYSLEQLGMPETTRAVYEQMLNTSHGILLITGPTGSGKTTTLYGSLQRLQSKEHNILTLEDPIEYQLDGISQMQVNTKKGVTFASGLRHLLRQDPDIIMVGEIRDEETARMAVQSSLTGHLVFATLHTNDAPGAVARMLDLGVEPYLVASSLIGVLGQRLVRRLCPACAEADEPTPAERRHLEPVLENANETSSIYRSRGCARCAQRGFVGRQGIFELLRIKSALRELIASQAGARQIHREAVARGGFESLRRTGLRRVLAGQTTLDEVLRVTLEEEQ